VKRSLLFLFLLVAPTAAADWPADLPKEGECVVCARRGADHGAERLVDWRAHEGDHFGFCSEGCAEAFDQMPTGYAPPVLPRAAPDFRWSTLDGEAIESTGQKALLVDFWATWCTPCLKVMPELDALARDFADDGFGIVGVSIDEDRDDLESFLERRPVDYAIVHDGGEDPAWWKFRVPAIPAAFLLDAEGRIVAQWNGEIDTDELRTRVEELVAKD
jgi:thiol-disulfide isomerase/thioredoxin